MIIKEFDIDFVLSIVFTQQKRYLLRKNGYNYYSDEWIFSSRLLIERDGVKYSAPTGTHTLQVFCEKGTKCVKCGVEGGYFAAEESGINKAVLNLYTNDDVLMTKDHIIPKSYGGGNYISNYQPMCKICNNKKANKW